MARLEAKLKRAGSRERAAHEKRYLKSDLVHYGVTMPELRRTAKELARERELGRVELTRLVRELWRRPVHECRMLAVLLLELHVELLRPGDTKLIEKLLRQSRGWALVDTLATHVMGPLVERHTALVSTLDRWARDEDFWLRRSAMLALLMPLRRGEGDFGRFGRYADRMLEEKEFFIRKAIGWVLRETSKRDPETVVAWLEPRVARASGVTLREALKYLPAAKRARLVRLVKG